MNKLQQPFRPEKVWPTYSTMQNKTGILKSNQTVLKRKVNYFNDRVLAWSLLALDESMRLHCPYRWRDSNSSGFHQAMIFHVMISHLTTFSWRFRGLTLGPSNPHSEMNHTGCSSPFPNILPGYLRIEWRRERIMYTTQNSSEEGQDEKF